MRLNNFRSTVCMCIYKVHNFCKHSLIHIDSIVKKYAVLKFCFNRFRKTTKAAH